MGKKSRAIIIILAVLFIAAAALLLISRGSILKGLNAQELRTLTITGADGESVTLDMNSISSFPSDSFEATVRSSGEKPKNVVYTGVELSVLLASAGFETENIGYLIFSGADLYTVRVEAKELEASKNIYVVYMADGEQLKTRAGGGDGPYQLVIAGDYYSLRWCKYLSEVTIY